MIKIICGDDIVSSREYFNRIKKTFTDKKFQVIEINSSNINQIISQIDSNLTLFQQKIVYFGQFLSQTFKKNKSLLNKIKKIHRDKKIILYIYEDKKKYDLVLYKDLEIIEFKPAKNIFFLLNLFIPKNNIKFLRVFHQVINEKNIDLFFYLLTKRVRDLLVIKNGGKPEKMSPWQITNLKKQAKVWDRQQLINIYQSLFRIEIDRKTSQTPFTLSESLDILIYYHLS